MRPLFEELASDDTPMGVLALRRRVLPGDGRDVFEVKLGDEFLMSSLFTVAEEQLARLGLGRHDGTNLSVVVGGLGLGWTAFTALEDPRVAIMTVVEALPQVIGWHRDGLLPGAAGLVADPRTTLAEGDVFAWASGGQELPDVPAAVDVFLLDVDHSPRHVLAPSHADFYTSRGLARMAERLRSGGVFALWSNDPPDQDFLDRLEQVFTDVSAEVVTFRNFLIDDDSSNTVYLAHTSRG